MRAAITWLLVLSAGFAWADEPNDGSSGEFVVTRYRLAFVHVGDGGEITNEYVPHDETLDNWSTLIAVRVWPKAQEVAEISGPYLRALQPLMVRDGQVYEPPGSEPGTDVVAELYLAPQDRSYLEYNLIRFVQEPGTEGVKSYQYAVKGEFDLESAVKFNAANLESRLTTIGGLQLDATTEDIEDADDAADNEEETAESDDEDEDLETEVDDAEEEEDHDAEDDEDAVDEEDEEE